MYVGDPRQVLTSPDLVSGRVLPYTNCFLVRITVDQPCTRKTDLTGLLPNHFLYLPEAKEQKEHMATSSQARLQT